MPSSTISPGIMFYHTSSQAVLKIEANTYEYQEAFSQNNKISNIMRVGDNILAATAEIFIDEIVCLLKNHSTCSAFINSKYMSTIRDSPDGKYIRVY